MKKNKFILAGTLAAIITLTGCNKTYNKKIANITDYTEETKFYSAYQNEMENEDIKKIPQETEKIYFNECYFITDLSTLPYQCPNIKELIITKCPCITDLSFIYSMENLKIVDLEEIIGITDELIDYLNDNNIRYKIDDETIKANQIASNIINEIIADNMTDEEKIKAIVCYMSKNCSYNIFKGDDSNYFPLSTTLIEKKGVCAGIAYTTNVLLRLAGIESYEVANYEHIWNIVKINDKYSYIDVTNLGGGLIPKSLAGTLIDKLNLGMGGYLIDPGTTYLTAMSNFKSEEIVFPNKLIEDIENNIDRKTLYERYKNTTGVRIIELLILYIGIRKAITQLKKDKSKSK